MTGEHKNSASANINHICRGVTVAERVKECCIQSLWILT
jgi:hypothetical protein